MMRIYNPRGWVSAVAAVFFLISMTAVNGEAAVLIHKTFNDLVGEADAVLAGTVTDKQSVWADDKSTIYTFVTLSDLDVIDGDYTEPTFVLRLEGGEVEDGVTKEVKGIGISGMPKFYVDERVVVFVRNNIEAFCPFVGGPQGVFRVKVDAATGEERLYTALDHCEVAGVDGEGNILVKEECDSSAISSQVKIVEKNNLLGIGVRQGHKSDAEAKKKKAEIQAMRFAIWDMRYSIESKARDLRSQGKKDKKKALSADVTRDRTGKLGIIAGQPPTEWRQNQDGENN